MASVDMIVNILCQLPVLISITLSDFSISDILKLRCIDTRLKHCINIQKLSLLVSHLKTVNINTLLNSLYKTKLKRIDYGIIVGLLNNPEVDLKTSGSDAIITASRNGHDIAVKMLLMCGIDLPSDLDHLLERAAEDGYVGVVRLLLEHGAKPSALVLENACMNGHAEIASMLFSRGVKLPRDDYALFRACEKGYTDVVELLLEHGVNSNIEDLFRSTCINGHVEIVRLLLEHGEVDQQTLNTANTVAVRYGHVDVVNLLLDVLFERHGVCTTSDTLSEAIINDHLEMVELLLDYGPDSHSLIDPIIIASSKSNHNIVRMLLEYGADPTVCNNQPIRLARLNGDREIVQLLLDYGANE